MRRCGSQICGSPAARAAAELLPSSGWPAQAQASGTCKRAPPSCQLPVASNRARTGICHFTTHKQCCSIWTKAAAEPLRIYGACSLVCELRNRIELTLCTGSGARIMMKALTRHWGNQTHAAERWRIGTASSRRALEKLGFTVSRLVSAAALSPASQAPYKLLLLLLQNTTQCRPGYSTTQATL